MGQPLHRVTAAELQRCGMAAHRPVLPRRSANAPWFVGSTCPSRGVKDARMPRVRAAASILIAAAMAASPGAAAWGNRGHQVVAAIAERRLTPRTAQAVRELLGGRSLSDPDLVSWADEVRVERPFTSSWHYVDIPLQAGTFDPERDCPREACVVGQVSAARRRLFDAKASLAQRREALLFLVHFVGDLHQPLHTIGEDHGGNGISVEAHEHGLPVTESLHILWDVGVVDAAMEARGTMRYAALLDRSLSPAQVRELSQGTPVDWTNQAHRIAQRLYAGLPASSGWGGARKLSSHYEATQSALVALQLSRAGVRLAGLLNGIFDPHGAPSVNPVQPVTR